MKLPGLGSLLLAVALLASLALRAADAPEAEFTRVAALMQAKKTDEAVCEIDAHIRRYPDDTRQSQIRAQLAPTTPAAPAKAAALILPAATRTEPRSLEQVAEEDSSGPVGSDNGRRRWTEFLQKSEPFVKDDGARVDVPRVVATAAAESPSASVEMGRSLFEQKGSNSCMFCHGAGGRDGAVKVAARLDDPKSWKSYRATGGDAPKTLAALKELIKRGSIFFNASYRATGYDWAAAGKIDAQMMGFTGGPSVDWLSRNAALGVTADTAAEAVLLYLKTLSPDNILK